MRLIDKTITKKMVDDIKNSAEQNNVDVFAYKETQRSILITEVNIYGTNGIEKYINENLNIYEKNNKTLFLGTRRFKFNDLEDISKTNSTKFFDFRVSGKQKDVLGFFNDLALLKYMKEKPNIGYSSRDTFFINIVYFIWFIIASITLLLTFYDMLYQKKENLIRISLGAKISRIIWKNILFDSLIYIFIFVITMVSLSKFTPIFIRLKIIILSFILFLIINSLLYINLNFFNLKEVFSNVKISRKLLIFNYALKISTVIITLFILSGNMVLIIQSYHIYKQKKFFEDHSQYYYTHLGYKSTKKDRRDASDIMNEKFYRKFFEKFDATLLTSVIGDRYVIANRNALDYLKSEIQEIRPLVLKKEIYFILPEKMSDNNEIIMEMNNTVKRFEGDNYDYDIIYYKGNIDIISIDYMDIKRSNIVRNPFIIYNNVPANTLDTPINTDLFKILYWPNIMYKISDKEFEKFIKDYDLTNDFCSKENVYEIYLNNWRVAKNILYINIIFSMLMLLLEFFIIRIIIKLEYEVNAVELSIKKIMGFNIFQKNKKIVLITVLTTMSAIVLSSVLFIVKMSARLTGIISDLYCGFAIGGIIILILELIIITFYIRKIENSQIQKILKGGNV